MLSRIFPKQIDNDYRGYQLAVWLLALLLLMKIFAVVSASGLNPFWTSRDFLQGVEKVPLDNFGRSAADAAILLFAWWGFTALILTVLGLIAVVRYRAMIPLIYLLTVLNHIGQQMLTDSSPVVGMLGAHASRPLIAIAVLLIGFAMSLTTPRRLDAAA